MSNRDEFNEPPYESDNDYSWFLPPLAEAVELDLGPRREARLESFLARDGIRKVLERAQQTQAKPESE